MTEPVVFISRFRVKEGKLNDFVKLYLERIPRTEAEKPGTVVQLGFVNQDGTQITITRAFPDTDAFEQQLIGSDERSKAVFELIEPTAIDIYGIPGSNALEMIKRAGGAGIEVNLYPQFIGGFIH